MLRGETLKTRLESGPITFSDAIYLLFPVMSGLAAAHRMGILHRDLKPANIFIAKNAEGRVVPKLLDLGVLKQVGTKRYMAPEQSSGRRVSPSTDVWSMGVVLYEALSGSPPFDGEDESAIQEARFKKLADAAPSLPPQVADLIDRAIRVDPQHRYPDMRVFLRALTDTAETLNITSDDRAVIQMAKTLATKVQPAGARQVGGKEEMPKLGESDRRPVIDEAMLAKIDETIARSERKKRPFKLPIPFGLVLAVLLLGGTAGAFTWMSGFEIQPAPFDPPAEEAIADAAQASAVVAVVKTTGGETKDRPRSATVARMLKIVSGDPSAGSQDTTGTTESQALDAKLVEQAERQTCDRFRSELTERIRAGEAELPNLTGPVLHAANHDLGQLKAAKLRCDRDLFGGSDWARAQGRLVTAEDALKSKKFEAAERAFAEATAIEERTLAKCKAAVEGNATPVATSSPEVAPVADSTPVHEDRASAKMHFEKAKSLKDAGKLDEAIAELDRAIQMAPDFVAAHNSRGLLLQTKKDPKGAIESFDRAIARDPNNASLYHNRGVSKEAAGDHVGAIDDLTRAIGIDGSKALFFQRRAESEQAMGKLDRAVEDYGAAITKEPGKVEPYYARGIAQETLKNYAAADADFSRVIELAPDRTDAYWRRGLARAQLGNTESSIKDFNEVIKRDAKHAGAYMKRGYAYAKLGRTKEAEVDLVKYLELEPQSKFKQQVQAQIDRLRKR
jgi:tetratricopeptide (TPR) repeat protein